MGEEDGTIDSRMAAAFGANGVTVLMVNNSNNLKTLLLNWSYAFGCRPSMSESGMYISFLKY